MTKKDDENFESSTKCSICDNSYVDGDVRIRDIETLLIEIEILILSSKLNHKVPIVFQNLKNYEVYLIM